MQQTCHSPEFSPCRHPPVQASNDKQRRRSWRALEGRPKTHLCRHHRRCHRCSSPSPSCHVVAISKARAGQQCHQFVAGPSAALPSLSSPSIERELANSAIRCHLRCCQASERKPTMPPQHCLLLRCCHHRALLTALPLSLLSAPISERESTMPTRHCHRHCAPSLLLSSIK